MENRPAFFLSLSLSLSSYFRRQLNIFKNQESKIKNYVFLLSTMIMFVCIRDIRMWKKNKKQTKMKWKILVNVFGEFYCCCCLKNEKTKNYRIFSRDFFAISLLSNVNCCSFQPGFFLFCFILVPVFEIDFWKIKRIKKF